MSQQQDNGRMCESGGELVHIMGGKGVTKGGDQRVIS